MSEDITFIVLTEDDPVHTATNGYQCAEESCPCHRVRQVVTRWYNWMQLRDMEITPEDLYLVIQVNSTDEARVHVTLDACKEIIENR